MAPAASNHPPEAGNSSTPNGGAQPGAHPQMSRLLFLLGCISILTPFSLDMYLPGLPSIAVDLHESPSAVQLTMPAFFVGLAVSQLCFGSLADQFGRRPPLLIGLLIFVAGSVGCALAPNVLTLTVFRVIQSVGVASAGVIPRAIVRDRFDIAHMARAMSLLGLISGLGPILAPQVGSAVLLLGSWRLEFWLLTIMGCAALLATYTSLPESIPVKGNRVGPRMWFKLLSDRRYLRYAIPANLVTSAAFAYIAGAPFVFIDHFKMSPQQFGWAFGANSIGLMIGSRTNAAIVSRVGAQKIFRRAIVCTGTLSAVLFGLAAADVGGFWGLMIPLFLLISSLGFLFSNGLALCLVPFGNVAGTVAALFGSVQFAFAGLCGVAVSAFYDGTARAMTGVMCAAALAGLGIYRLLR